jgi:hypothetical protein
MAIRRMNHAVLYVRDADRPPSSTGTCWASAWWGVPVPRSSSRPRTPRTTTTSRCSDRDRTRATPRRPVDGRSYHIAWEVQTLGDLQGDRAEAAGGGALVGATDHSTTKALYAKDPTARVRGVLARAGAVPERRVVAARRLRPLNLQADSSATAWRPSAASEQAPYVRISTFVKMSVCGRPAGRVASVGPRRVDHLVGHRDLVVVTDEAPTGEEGLPRIERCGADHVRSSRSGPVRRGALVGLDAVVVDPGACQIANIVPADPRPRREELVAASGRAGAVHAHPAECDHVAPGRRGLHGELAPLLRASIAFWSTTQPALVWRRTPARSFRGTGPRPWPAGSRSGCCCRPTPGRSTRTVAPKLWPPSADRAKKIPGRTTCCSPRARTRRSGAVVIDDGVESNWFADAPRPGPPGSSGLMATRCQVGPTGPRWARYRCTRTARAVVAPRVRSAGRVELRVGHVQTPKYGLEGVLVDGDELLVCRRASRRTVPSARSLETDQGRLRRLRPRVAVVDGLPDVDLRGDGRGEVAERAHVEGVVAQAVHDAGSDA